MDSRDSAHCCRQTPRDSHRLFGLTDFDVVDLEPWDIKYSNFHSVSLAGVYFSLCHWCSLLFLMAFHAGMQHILWTDSVWLTPQDNSATSGDCEALSSNIKSLILGTWHYLINSASYSVCALFCSRKEKKTPGIFFLFYWVQGRKKETLLKNIFYLLHSFSVNILCCFSYN